MDNILHVLVIGAVAGEISDLVVAVMGFMACCLPFALLLPIIMNSEKDITGRVGKFFGDKFRGGGKAISNAAGSAVGGVKEDLQGKVAAGYNPNDSKERNFAKRLFTGTAAPGARSRRKLAAMGKTYKEGGSKEGKEMLDAGRIRESDEQATIAAGGTVRGVSGSDPLVRRAAIQKLIENRDHKGLKKAFMDSADTTMIEDEINAKYGDVSGFGAHLTGIKGADLAGKTRSEKEAVFHQKALKSMSELSPGALATQKPEAIADALEGLKLSPTAPVSVDLAKLALELKNTEAVWKDVKSAPRQRIEEIITEGVKAGSVTLPATTPSTTPVVATPAATTPPVATPTPTPTTSTSPTVTVPAAGPTTLTISHAPTAEFYTKGYSSADLGSLDPTSLRQIINSAGMPNLTEADIRRIADATRGNTTYSDYQNIYNEVTTESRRRRDAQPDVNITAGPDFANPQTRQAFGPAPPPVPRGPYSGRPRGTGGHTYDVPYGDLDDRGNPR